MTRQELIARLAQSGVRADKSLGQNFLVEPEVLDEIVASAGIRADDTVLEIGPGLGFLTERLAQQARRLVVIEKDERMIAHLRSIASNLEIRLADILDSDLSDLVEYKVVANIPYYITSPIFRKLLSGTNRPSSITALVQKEVAERICAKPGKMSVLALSVQYYGEPRYVRTVPAESFVPAPKVDSAVLHIEVFDQPAFAADEKQLFRLIKAGFGEKRKMLRNSLAGGLHMDSESVMSLLKDAGIIETARAQELSLDQWQSLYQTWQAI